MGYSLYRDYYRGVHITNTASTASFHNRMKPPLPPVSAIIPSNTIRAVSVLLAVLSRIPLKGFLCVHSAFKLGWDLSCLCNRLNYSTVPVSNILCIHCQKTFKLNTTLRLSNYKRIIKDLYYVQSFHSKAGIKK